MKKCTDLEKSFLEKMGIAKARHLCYNNFTNTTRRANMKKTRLIFKAFMISFLILTSVIWFASCNDPNSPVTSTPDEDEVTTDQNPAEDPWENESKLAFEKREDGYWVIGRGEYLGGDIVVPSTYKGEPVVGIADNAFFPTFVNPFEKGDSDIASVVINEGVKHIGNSAFRDNIWLSSIDLPSSLISIGENAFGKCNSITHIEIPNSVTHIGAGAFLSCARLASITLPSSVLVIDERAFGYCRSLEEITLPEKITEIAPSLFEECSELKKVTVTGTITVIGESAFEKCIALSSFAFNEGLSEIGTSAFASCYALTSVSFPDSILKIGEKAFYRCYALNEISWGNGLREIGESAFSSCSALTTVSLPDSITDIGSGAFSGCWAVKSLTIGKGLTVIPEGAFLHMTGLEGLVIPDGVVEICRSAFDDLSNLKNLTIPKSVKKMEYCFNSTSNIENIYYEGSLEDWLLIDMPTVASSPLYYSSSARLHLNGVLLEGDLVIPESVTRINDYAFENYRYITSLTFPHDMEYIGTNAFGNCSGIESITFLGDVAEFGDQSFHYCTSLTTINFGAKLTKTGFGMFSYCASLKTLVIPSNIKRIQSYSFNGCGLEEVYFSEGVEIIEASSFQYIRGIDVYLPASIKEIEGVAFTTAGKITYAGTVASWKNVAAHHLWNEIYTEFPVYCSNGTVIIPDPYS